MTSTQCEKAGKYLEYICTKQGVLEQRQCDSVGEGTDASRMFETWTRGEHINVSGRAFEKMRVKISMTGSWKATRYESIFEEKDFIRGEKELSLFFEQFVRGVPSGARKSEKYEDIGTSLPYLPIWRGTEQVFQERDLEKVKNDEYKKAMALEQFLPGEAEGYDESYKAAHELMLPLDTRFESERFIKDNEWRSKRHTLRRVPLRTVPSTPSRAFTRRSRPSCSTCCERT